MSDPSTPLGAGPSTPLGAGPSTPLGAGPSTPLGAGQVAVSLFVEFTRAEWAQLRDATPLPLTEPQLRRLVSVNERMSLDEVADIYLPLSRLLNLYVGAMQNLHAASATFLGTDTPR